MTPLHGTDAISFHTIPERITAMSRRRHRPLAEFLAYLEKQLAEVREELERTKAELEDYRQAEAFGWPAVHAKRTARAKAAVAKIVDDPKKMLAEINADDTVAEEVYRNGAAHTARTDHF